MSGEKITKLQNKSRGALVGLAVGDALGAHYEFGWTSELITKVKNEVREMHESEDFPKGVWTDDTSMALCLADSLLECGGYNSFDIMEKYLKWRNDGYRSYFPFGMGIGLQIDKTIEQFESGKRIISKDEERGFRAGNGAIMRLAPVITAMINETEKTPTKTNLTKSSAEQKKMREAVKLAKISARETHYSVVAEAGTEIFGAMLYLAMLGFDKKDIFKYFEYGLSNEARGVWLKNEELFGRAFYEDDCEKLKDLGGFVLDAIAIAGWGFLHFDNFEDGMIAVICLGGDTDTNAAIYGQLAGAYYGYSAIPKRWTKDLYLCDEIIELSDKLLAMKTCPIIETRFEEDSK